MSELAELYSMENMEEEAIALYKQDFAELSSIDRRKSVALLAVLPSRIARILVLFALYVNPSCARCPYAQAYSIEKEVSGPDSVKLAQHLKNLGATYEKQGKTEAATLTLEEAGESIF